MKNRQQEFHAFHKNFMHSEVIPCIPQQLHAFYNVMDCNVDMDIGYDRIKDTLLKILYSSSFGSIRHSLFKVSFEGLLSGSLP